MTMMQSVRSVLGRYATFSGRASRSEYWWWFLAVFLFLFVVTILDMAVVMPALGMVNPEDSNGPLGFVAALAIILPNLAVGARRLHDIGRTGWWLLAGFRDCDWLLHHRPSSEWILLFLKGCD